MATEFVPALLLVSIAAAGVSLIFGWSFLNREAPRVQGPAGICPARPADQPTTA